MQAPAYEQYGAYKAQQGDQETPRETEARALLGCARRLEAVNRSEAERDEYVNAIKTNQQLWTLFQVTLCEQENPLPKDLKTTLLNLSIYVDKTSFQLLTEYNASEMQSLIDININLAAGLSVKQRAATYASAETDVPASVQTSV